MSRPSGAGGYMHHSRKRRPRSPFEGPPSPRVDEASLRSSYCAPWLPMPLKLAGVGKKHGVRERRALWRRQSTKQEIAGAQTLTTVRDLACTPAPTVRFPLQVVSR